MFPDVEIVRSVQAELDLVIEEGVGNIVQLLKNADSGVTSGAAKVLDEDAFEAKNRQKMNYKKWHHDDKKLTSNVANKDGSKQPPGLYELLTADELNGSPEPSLDVRVFISYYVFTGRLNIQKSPLPLPRIPKSCEILIKTFISGWFPFCIWSQ